MLMKFDQLCHITKEKISSKNYTKIAACVSKELSTNSIGK